MDANGKTSSARSRALSTLGEKYQILPYMGFAFLYAWVQMTFHSEAWIDWGQHGSAAAQWLFPLTNIPFVIIGIVGARWQLVIYRALFKRTSVATVILLGTGGSLLMVAGLLSSSDACFIVGCLIADSGTAFATLGLSALYAEQGPHRTVVLVSMGIGLGSLFWFMATSLPFYLAAAIYGCLPLFAMLCLLTRAGSFQREAADIVSGPSSIASLPQDLGRLMGMLTLFSAITGIAVPLLGSAENPNPAQVMEFFVIGACGVLICLCAREYGMRTVENAYSFLALATTILMLSAVMIHAESAAFWALWRACSVPWWTFSAGALSALPPMRAKARSSELWPWDALRSPLANSVAGPSASGSFKRYPSDTILPLWESRSRLLSCSLCCSYSTTTVSALWQEPPWRRTWPNQMRPRTPTETFATASS